MSPKKLRNRHLMNQFVTTRSKAKRHSFINLDTSLQHKGANAKNQKADESNVSLLNDSQLKNEKNWHIRLSKKKTSSIRPKTYNISTRNSLTRSHNRKVSKDMHDNSILDISNMSHELLQEMPVKFKSTPGSYSKKTQYKKSPEQLSVSFNRKSRKSNSYSRSPKQLVTPKSSPISVTLTPLRTTKTPKRSPLNLRSPKSHPGVSLRLSQTPRKLMLFNNSTSTLGSPNTSLELKKNTRSRIQNSSLSNTTMSNAKAKSKKLKSIRTSIEQLKFTPQRLSRTPKMILRSPKLRSNSPKLKMKLDTKKVEDFSTSKSRLSNKNDSTKVITLSNKKDTDHKLSSSEESDLDLTLTNNLSAQYKNIMSRKPIVILERNSLLDNLGESFKIQGNQSNILKKSISANLLNERNKELNKTNIVASSTPNTQLKKRLSDIISLHSPKAKSSPVINKRLYNKSPSTSMSNLDKTKSILVESNVENTTYNKDTTNDDQNKTMIIENDKTDETYEVFEPKTPHLQLRCRKRVLTEVETDKEDVKKVRFDTTENHIKKVQTNSNTSIRKTPLAKYIPRKRSSTVSTAFTNKNVLQLELRKRSNSMPSANSTPYKNIKTKEKTPPSTLDKTKHSKRQKDIKMHSEKKKIPNFAEIHKQMFAKMESLVDNKQRVKKQHEALKESPKIIKSGKKSPTKLISPGKKNMYTKFGFKIRKTDAKNIILRKDQPNVQKQKREEARAFLKGVRTNRRFELQMKMRKASK